LVPVILANSDFSPCKIIFLDFVLIILNSSTFGPSFNHVNIICINYVPVISYFSHFWSRQFHIPPLLVPHFTCHVCRFGRRGEMRDQKWKNLKLQEQNLNYFFYRVKCCIWNLLLFLGIPCTERSIFCRLI